MPIIINEFEIIPEPAPPPDHRPERRQPGEQEPRLTPEEVVRIVNRHQERLQRLWAD
jgi:hypothetical protein